MNSNNTIGNNIRGLREAYKLTQIDLADALGISDTLISMYEKGQRTPPEKRLNDIADFFELSVEELVSQDFSALDFRRISEIDCSFVYSFLTKVIPILKSESALKNASFEKAFIAQKKIYRNLSIIISMYFSTLQKIIENEEYEKAIDPFVDLLVDERRIETIGDDYVLCFDEYETAVEDPFSAEEALANQYGLWILASMIRSIIRLATEKGKKSNIFKALMYRKDKNEVLYNYEFENNESVDIFEPDSLEDVILGFMNEILTDHDIQNEMRQNLVSLRKSSKHDLAYHYLVLSEIFDANAVYNSIDIDKIELIWMLSKIGNPYAVRFLQYTRKALRRLSK